MRSAKEVIVIGAPARRLKMARRLGATTVIDLGQAHSAESRLQQVLDLTDGRGADVVIEAAGSVAAFAEGVQLVAKNGRYLIVGIWSAPGAVPVEPRLLNNANLRIVGSALYEPRQLYSAIQLAMRYHERLPMTEVVSHRFSLRNAQQALEVVERLEAIKAVIAPNSTTSVA